MAVMEKTKSSIVMPLNAADDIGSWKSLWEIKDKDNKKNVSKEGFFKIPIAMLEVKKD